MSPILRLALSAGLLGHIVSAAGAAQTRHEIVRGRVTTDSARAVRDANVLVTRLADRVVKTTKTGVDGQYAVDWTDGSGDYAVAVNADGFQPTSFRLTRTSADSVLVANVRLAPVTRLNAVVTRASRPVPDRDPANYGAGGSESSTIMQNTARRLAPDQAGDINAIAAMLPGVAATPGGISVLGLPPGQNSVTLNGLSFPGADVPRDAVTRVRVLTSTYDPSNGWFSGAQTAVDLTIGSQFTQRTTHWTVDAPALQYTDRVSAQSGQRFTNLNVGLGGNGQLFSDAWAYNFGVQAGRKAADVASMLDADGDLSQHAGVARDSALRLLGALGQLGVPVNEAGVPTGAVDQNVSFIGRVDHTPYDWSKRAYTPTTYGVQAYAKFSQTGAQGFSPLATPAHGWSSSASIASLTGFFTTLFGPSYLADVRSGVTLTRTGTDPYLSLPDGRARVVSAMPGGSGISTLQFGGSGGTQTTATLARWETNAQLQLYPEHLVTHRIKLAADARYDSYEQNVRSNQFGTFVYNSLADVVANQPASFTRTLTTPTRKGGEWNAFLSAGDMWRVSSALALVYGVRADGNVFTSRPAFNPVVRDRFGLRTDGAPSSVSLSPRLGFTWQAKAGTTLRGGIGQFRNLVDASLLAAPSVSTGLPGTMLRLSCVGAAVPTPDWAAYFASTAAIPRNCADGAGAFVDSTPNVQLVDAGYRPQRSWRSNLGMGSSVRKNVFTVEGVLSLNLDQPGTFDANFSPRSRFALSDEGRAVFVPASSIVATTGALSPIAGRADPSFGRVLRAVSDLRSVSEQGIFTLRPFIPDRVRSYFGDVILSYTLTHIRAQQRGFDGGAFGDPTRVDWARGDLDARHLFVAQSVFRPMGDGRAIMFLSARVQSGLPFTPLVAGDVNGDGLANDRAFVADSPELRSLIASAEPNVRRCLTSQIGQAASRNGCEGPWTAQLNAGLRLSGALLRSRRTDVTLNFANALAGLDQLLHGSNVRGWGSPAVPDPTLYTVRGFDATNQRFLYDLNQRFGNTRASNTALRAPFRVTLDVAVDIARAVPDQMLDRWLKPGRAGRTGARITADDLSRRFQTTVPDPFADLLQQTDSLLLTGDQVSRLQAVETAYRAHVDAAWNQLSAYLAALPDRYDFSGAARRVDDTTDDLWEYSRHEVQQMLPEILTPLQLAQLSGWTGQLYRSRDRLHIRLTPHGG